LGRPSAIWIRSGVAMGPIALRTCRRRISTSDDRKQQRECAGPGPNSYRLALFRFAQDAFTFFDMAFRAAALHGRRFCLVVG